MAGKKQSGREGNAGMTRRGAHNGHAEQNERNS
jgi:hypothetical protein